MSKILITGGAGFIPSSLAEALLEDGHNLILVDNLLTGLLSNVPKHPNCTFIKVDVNNYHDIAAVMTAHKFDYVFHYAAMVGVKRTTDNPVGVLRDIDGIKNVLELCKNTGVKRVFFSSSSEVYGEPVEIPQNELTTPLNSRLPYAIVKNVGEAFLKSYYREFGLEYNIFRFFNTYGPKQSADFVISKFIQAAKNNENITIYGDGSQTRTFCYIDDNIKATIAVFKSDSLVNETINFGNSKEISILELAKTIIQMTNSRSEIVHLPPLKEGDMIRRCPDNTKMLQLVGSPLIPLEQGLAKLL